MAASKPGPTDNRKRAVPIKVAGKKETNYKKNAPSGFGHVRWVALVLAIGLMGASLVLRSQPQLLPQSSSLASDMFGKVGIVLMCMWLAWPAIESLIRAPSGVAYIAAVTFAVGLFIYRPKTIWVTGPFLLVGAGIILILNWIRTSGKR